MKRFLTSALALVVALSLGAASFAAINVDEDGVGFLAKGRVQSLFGWNNAEFQNCVDPGKGGKAPKNVGDTGCLSFHLQMVAIDTEERTWFCDGVPHHEVQTRVTTTTNDGSIFTAEARKGQQVTGFNLNGVILDTGAGKEVDRDLVKITLPDCDHEDGWVEEWILIHASNLIQLTITDTRFGGATHVIEEFDEEFGDE